MRIEYPDDLLNSDFATLECSRDCKGIVLEPAILYPANGRTLVTVQKIHHVLMCGFLGSTQEFKYFLGIGGPPGSMVRSSTSQRVSAKLLIQ